MLADGYVRFRGEAVLALVGDPATILAIRDDEVPIAWEPLPALLGIDAALDAGRGPAPRGVAGQRPRRGGRAAGRRRRRPGRRPP